VGVKPSGKRSPVCGRKPTRIHVSNSDGGQTNSDEQAGGTETHLKHGGHGSGVVMRGLGGTPTGVIPILSRASREFKVATNRPDGRTPQGAAGSSVQDGSPKRWVKPKNDFHGEA